MKGMLKEPLLAFLLLGAGIFVLFQQLSDEPVQDRAEIIVTEGRIAALSQGFTKVWKRVPSAEEMDKLIQGYIREEILYREALAMGLDHDDSIVRRRMRQKIEFISEDLTRANEPDERELQAYLAAHLQAYRSPSRFSFRQVYFNRSKRGQAAYDDAESLLATLQKDSGNHVDVTTLGDLSMLKQMFREASGRDVAHDLGPQFLHALDTLPVGHWQGPITSAFGLHLVYLDERITGKDPQLKDVRKAVLRDWSSAERKKVNAAFYASLRSRYTVIVQSPVQINNATRGVQKVSMATAP